MEHSEAPKATATKEKDNPAKVVPAEDVYTADELAKNYKAFGTTYEIAVVALRQAGKKTATMREAKNIIQKFRNKEVK